jgi:hypothetical protein
MAMGVRKGQTQVTDTRAVGFVKDLYDDMEWTTTRLPKAPGRTGGVLHEASSRGSGRPRGTPPIREIPGKTAARRGSPSHKVERHDNHVPWRRRYIGIGYPAAAVVAMIA